MAETTMARGSATSPWNSSITKPVRRLDFKSWRTKTQPLFHLTERLYLLVCGGSGPTTPTSLRDRLLERPSRPTQTFLSYLTTSFINARLMGHQAVEEVRVEGVGG